MSDKKIGKKEKTVKSEICEGIFPLDSVYTSKTLEGEFKVDLHVKVM